jgi:hypothetical protein
MGLHREFAYIDLAGTTRYIDYALFGGSAKFAIELNGESFHHPAVIGPRRYRSQLFKQNSLVADRIHRGRTSPFSFFGKTGDQSELFIVFPVNAGGGVLESIDKH